MSWYLDSDDLLVHDDLPDPIESNLTLPYPASLWRLDSDDVLTLNNEDWTPFPESSPNFTSPYPATMWYLDDDGLLLSSILPEILINDSGAFNKNPNLTEIEFPDTVTYIGPYAFNDTGLAYVLLPNTCGYYATSFPQDCTVAGGHLIE